VPRRVEDFRGLTQPNRLRLLRAIHSSPGRDAHALAAECALPLNTVRDHLSVLEHEGLIRGEAMKTGTRGRPPIGFHPVRDAAASEVAGKRVAGAQARGTLLRAVTDAGAAGPTDPALDPTALAQLDVLYEHLDDAGLEPAAGEDPLTLDLAPCNYHDVIDADQSLVCSVHACLVKDMLAQVDGPLALKRLEPFVTAHRCRLVLTEKRGAASATVG
jgi:predicted ArsR family transcriptional regulator